MSFPIPSRRPLLAFAPLAVLAPWASAFDSASTELVSLSSSGVVGNGRSAVGQGRPIAMTDDGRFIAFTSQANNLVPGDTNGATDVFLRDRELGTTVRCSVGDAGQQGNGSCESVSISANGRFVAYASRSNNLVPGDTNGRWDVFLWDASTGTSTLVSRSVSGFASNGDSSWPSIDAAGTRVVFRSRASNLVSNDANGRWDVFVYERLTGAVSVASVGSGDEPGAGDSETPMISRDGRFVVFASESQWDPIDPDSDTDIYVRDLVLGTTTLVGGQSGGYGADLSRPSISSGGRYVSFQSTSTLIPDGATNGWMNVYRYDRLQDSFSLISQSTDGAAALESCYIDGMSADGEWVSFHTMDPTLVPGISGLVWRSIVRRVDQRWTEIVSIGDLGRPLDNHSGGAVLSLDGRYACFETIDPDGSVLDNGTFDDVIVRDRGFGTGAAGGTYCDSATNSSGAAAELSVLGTNRLADQQLTLRAELLPTNSLGYFLFSETADDVLGFGGSQGRLCLGGQIFRLSSFVQFSGGNGQVALPLPFAQLPSAATLSVGDTWNFQYWFRDAVGGQPTSNTSSAVCVPLF
ncbi:MAG: hypothetical protein AAF726_12700 [Planctomycetota bacterium]